MAVNEYRRNDWNLDHVAKHGVTPAEAERVVDGAARGWPRTVGDNKLTVQGRGNGNRVVQVVYLIDTDGFLYVIHAMPMTTRRRR